MIYTPEIPVMRQLAGTRDYAVRGGVGSGYGARGRGGGEERDDLIGRHTYRQTDKQTDTDAGKTERRQRQRKTETRQRERHRGRQRL